MSKPDFPRSVFRPNRRTFLAGTAGAALLAGCSSSAQKPVGGGGSADSADVDAAIDWASTNLPNLTPDIIRKAAEEGEVTLTLQLFGDEAWRQFHDAFTKRFPFIRVNSTTQSVVQLMQKFTAELNAKRGIGDIFILESPAVMPEFIEDGSIAEFEISEDSGFADENKEVGRWYAFHRQFGVSVYRKDGLPAEEVELLRTWEGLGDPRFRGRLGITDVTSGIASTQSYALQHQADPGLWEGLAANRPTVKPAVAAALDGLLAGEYDATVMASIATTNRTAQAGAPLEFVESSPGASNNPPQVISAIAPHPNAARVYQDWSLSKEAQQAWPGLSGVPSARTDITSETWYSSESWYHDAEESIQVDWPDFVTEHQSVVDTYNNAFK